MGVSTDAILCYGFRIKDNEGEEEQIVIDWLLRDSAGGSDDDDQMDFEDFLAKVSGLQEPDDSLDNERFDTDPDYHKAWSDYWARKRKLKEEFDVTLVYHCSGEYPMYILAVKSSVQTAYRGDPIELGQSITAHDDWREKLRSFCEQAKIQFEEPQFILCSFWG